MAVTKKNRLKRFGHWSDDHQQRVLDRIGVSTGDFANYSGSRQRRVLNRALAKGGSTGGAEAPTVAIDPLKSAVDAAVNLKYRPAEREYNTQLTDSAQQDTNIDAWYQNYLNTLQGVQGQSADFYKSMAGADVPVPTAVPGDEASMAAANRAALANSMNSVIKGQGANMNALYGGQMADSQLAKVGWHQDEEKQRKDTRTKLGDLLLEKGDYANTYRQDLLDKQHQQQLEDSAFGLDKQKALTAAGYDPFTGEKIPDPKNSEVNKYGYSNKRWKSMPQAQRTKIIKNFTKSSSGNKPGDHYGYTDKQWAKMSHGQKVNAKAQWDKAGKKNTSGGLTAAATRTNRNAWSSALQYLRDNGVNAQTTVGEIQSNAKVPFDIAQAALYWGNHGAKLSSTLIKALRKLGINVADDPAYKGQG